RASSTRTAGSRSTCRKACVNQRLTHRLTAAPTIRMRIATSRRGPNRIPRSMIVFLIWAAEATSCESAVVGCMITPPSPFSCAIIRLALPGRDGCPVLLQILSSRQPCGALGFFRPMRRRSYDRSTRFTSRPLGGRSFMLTVIISRVANNRNRRTNCPRAAAAARRRPGTTSVHRDAGGTYAADDDECDGCAFGVVDRGFSAVVDVLRDTERARVGVTSSIQRNGLLNVRGPEGVEYLIDAPGNLGPGIGHARLIIRNP